ncbi:MAG: hypothetical protein HONBIEJF_00104 [Fimbriimonadaceae bacterium]|nr:hypothetical protein [Fimbriimonadaceae bacterium]
MIEIRTIKDAEARGFLGLLCSVFDLDFARASSVFFTEPFYDPRNKWALFSNGVLASILSLTPLEFGWGRAMGISGVATEPGHRRRGLARKLLDEVHRSIEVPTMLFAQSTTLYEACGYVQVDAVVRGQIKECETMTIGEALSRKAIEAAYGTWAGQDPSRLRRDERRWRFWNWTLRSCEAMDNGYIGVESTVVREAVGVSKHTCWPVGPKVDWLGLESMTQDIGVPLKQQEITLKVMTRNFPQRPQMFMSDQF